MIKMLGIMNGVIAEKKKPLTKDLIVAKNRGRAVVTLKAKNPDFENAIRSKTGIRGYQHGKTKHGYSYKFYGDMDWEAALDLFK